MKQTNRFLIAALMLAVVFFTSNAVAGTHFPKIEMKPMNSAAKSYIGTCDASGKISFPPVEPGTYELRIYLPEGTDQAGVESYSIDIQSFSWGASNPGTMRAQNNNTVRSNRTGTAITIDEPGTGGGGSGGSSEKQTQGKTFGEKVATGLQSGGKVSVQDFHFVAKQRDIKKSGGDYFVVVLKDILITGIVSPSGQISGNDVKMKAGWNLKENVK